MPVKRRTNKCRDAITDHEAAWLNGEPSDIQIWFCASERD
jgi:hypothetical protein